MNFEGSHIGGLWYRNGIKWFERHLGTFQWPEDLHKKTNRLEANCRGWVSYNHGPLRSTKWPCNCHWCLNRQFIAMVSPSEVAAGHRLIVPSASGKIHRKKGLLTIINHIMAHILTIINSILTTTEGLFWPPIIWDESYRISSQQICRILPDFWPESQASQAQVTAPKTWPVASPRVLGHRGMARLHRPPERFRTQTQGVTWRTKFQNQAGLNILSAALVIRI